MAIDLLINDKSVHAAVTTHGSLSVNFDIFSVYNESKFDSFLGIPSTWKNLVAYTGMESQTFSL